jgi:membrane glycosyltransferase
VTLFILRLPFGGRVGWTSQQRDAEGMPFLLAARKLWPQTILGIVLAAWLWKVAPDVIWYWAPILLGLVGSIPVAMVTAHRRVGRALAAAGICRIPEEARLRTGLEPASLFTPLASASPRAAE